MALLREIYGPAVEKLKVEAKTWKIDAGSRKVLQTSHILLQMHLGSLTVPDECSRDNLLRGFHVCAPRTRFVQVEVDLTTLSSNFHVEMNPSDAGMKDRYVVQARSAVPSKPAEEVAANSVWRNSFSLSCPAFATSTTSELGTLALVRIPMMFLSGGDQGDGQGEASGCRRTERVQECAVTAQTQRTLRSSSAQIVTSESSALHRRLLAVSMC